MKLHSLLSCLPQYNELHKENPDITSIEMDSREVVEGSLFVCIKGFTVDGHDFVQQAVDNGAVAIAAEKEVGVDVPTIVVNNTNRALAVLSDYFYGHPTHQLELIGVTGTNGKTTVTHMLEHIFRNDGKKTGMVGTIQNKIGDESFPVKNTTPESVALQKLFRKMVDQGVENVAMEVSSHALDLGRVRGCDFDIAVFTNLSQDHLDYHKTMEEYARAKGLLFSQLGNKYNHNAPKYAVINQDDELSDYYQKVTSAHVLTYGIENKSDVMASNIQMDSSGTSYRLSTPKGQVDIKMKLVGRFSVYNTLAAAAAALASNVSLSVIQDSIKTLEGVPGRFELVDEGQAYTVIVDYAHTPDSLENVLQTVKQFAKGLTYVVVGCGGDRDRTKRPLMAQVACKYADHAIFTSDNPRTESPEEILKDMEKGVEQDTFTTIIDRKKAIAHVISKANAEDVILIAGKGHETYQEINNKRFDFDDRLMARMAIRERINI